MESEIPVKFVKITRGNYDNSPHDDYTLYYVVETNGQISYYLGSSVIDDNLTRVTDWNFSGREGILYWGMNDHELRVWSEQKWFSVTKSVDWENIIGKPEKFPPSAHKHEISDVSGLVTKLAGVDASIAQSQANVTGLTNSLSATNAKVNKNLTGIEDLKLKNSTQDDLIRKNQTTGDANGRAIAQLRKNDEAIGRQLQTKQEDIDTRIKSVLVEPALIPENVNMTFQWAGLSNENYKRGSFYRIALKTEGIVAEPINPPESGSGGRVNSVNGNLPDEDGNVFVSIPTKVSQLINDSGYQTASEVNKSVTDATKPLATRQELTDGLETKADIGDIPKVPTVVSAFQNDARYQTESEVSQSITQGTESLIGKTLEVRTLSGANVTVNPSTCSEWNAPTGECVLNVEGWSPTGEQWSTLYVTPAEGTNITGGTNLTLKGSFTAGKVNYCQLKGFKGQVRLYVLEVED